MSEGGQGHTLPPIPDGWSWRRVVELAADEDRAITDGPFGSNLKTAHYTDSGPRVIRLQNIGDGEFIDAEAHISPAHFERLRAHEAKGGDVVVASLGETLPRACLVPDDLGAAVVKADCPRIRVGDEMRAEFLCAALNSPPVRQQAAGLVAGIGRPRLNLGKLKALHIPTPPLAEQDRIVEAIKRYRADLEEARGEVRAAAAQLIALRSAVLAHTLPRVSAVRLDEIADVRSGLTKGRKLKTDASPYPFLRAANLRDGYLDLDEIKEIPATTDEADRFKLERGDVLLVEGSGSVARLGQGWLWEGQLETCLHQNHVFRARPDQDVVLPRYLAWTLQGPPARAYFHAQTKTTSGLTTINRRQVGATPVPLPPIDVQRRVVATIERQLGASDALRARLHDVETSGGHLMRAVLSRAIRGELVAPAASEPAPLGPR